MPPRPRAPRTRASGIRRPRVAGLAPAASRADGTENLREIGGVALDDAIRPAAPTEDLLRPGLQPADLHGADLPGADLHGADLHGADRQTVELRTDDLQAEPVAPAEAVVDAPPAVDTPRRRRRSRPAEPVAESAAAAPDVEAAPRRSLRASLRRVAVPLLAVALVVFTGLAVFFGINNAMLRGTPAAANAALVDAPATAEATQELTDALKTVYSYDFARLDENEKASRAVITPAFADQFGTLFAQVRQLAPQQQAVVTATISMSALKSLDGDHAVLVAFMDQQATRVASGGQSSQLAASGRLTVTGEKVDGRWKIAGVESR